MNLLKYGFFNFIIRRFASWIGMNSIFGNIYRFSSTLRRFNFINNSPKRLWPEYLLVLSGLIVFKFYFLSMPSLILVWTCWRRKELHRSRGCGLRRYRRQYSWFVVITPNFILIRLNFVQSLCLIKIGQILTGTVLVTCWLNNMVISLWSATLLLPPAYLSSFQTTRNCWLS